MELTPQLNQVIYSTVAFFILLFLLGRFAFPPIVNMLEERAKKIRESLDTAERIRIEAEQLLQDYKKQLAEARAEAQQIIEQGRQFGESVKKEIVEKAKHQSDQMLSRATAEIVRERDLAISELQKQVADLTIGAASRVIGKSLSKDDHLKLIEQYLAEMGSVREN